jgi:tight adherence protein B
MVSVLASLLAAVGIWLWRGASATARVASPGPSAAVRRAALVRARLTSGRGVRRRERETVALLRALAGELRSGAPEAAAFAAAAAGSGAIAGSLTSLLAPAAAAVARGASLPAELRRVAATTGAARLLPVAAAWDVATRHGSSMAGLLDRLADAYDDEDAVRADLAASVAGSRASMLLLAGLPAAGLALGAAVGAHPWAWLFGRPARWAVCAVAVALDATGLMWTRWLLRGRS